MIKFLHFNVVLEPGTPKKLRQKNQSRTAAIEPLSAQDIHNIAKNFIGMPASAEFAVPLNVGVTFLSLKDRYSKKEGREEATKRMKAVLLDVKAVHITRNHIFVRLADIFGITLVLRLNKTSGFSTVVGTMNIGE